MAIDDTKEHRTSADVWDVCTFHESGARSPNRATTVRSHNWVVMGDLASGKPWTYMPTAPRLCFRKSQLPAGERFQTKTAMAYFGAGKTRSDPSCHPLIQLPIVAPLPP